MKLNTRIISTLLALLMMMGSLTFLSVIQVGAADLSEDSIKKTYTSKVYNTPEEKLADMEKMLEREGYELWVESSTGEVALVDKTGQILFSNPYDLASSKGSVDVKSRILSQISVQYLENGKSTALYSFPEAAVRNQIFVSLIKNGVRVEYTVGREESRKLVPRWISKERFETYIKAPLVEAVKKGELDEYWAKKVYHDYYELKSIKNLKSERAKQQLIAEYPICEVLDIYVLLFDTSSELNMLESYIKTYCEDYSFEMMDADHEETGYPAQDERYPMFKMALEYSLNEDGLSVRMPCNGLRYDMTNYPLESISILPYMGAGNGINEGYTFFPDGAGSLFAYKDVSLNEHIEVTGKIYGADYAYHNIENVAGTYQKTIRYPVYGAVSTETIYTYQYTQFNPETNTTSAPITAVVSNTVRSLEEIREELAGENFTQLSEIQSTTYKRGYVAIIQQGDSLGSLQVYAPGGSSTYNTVRNFFDPKPRDSYVVTDALSVNNNATWNITSNRKYTGSITLSYRMLSDETIAQTYKTEVDPSYTYYDASWLGMAENYRDYLCSEGVLTPLKPEEVEADVPLYIESFGTKGVQSSFLTIPITEMMPFATFDDIETMYTELSEAGVNNVNFRLTGYANGGLYSTVPSKLKWEKSVGGKAGFEELVEYMKSVNADAAKHLGIYPDFDFAYLTMDTMFDNTNLKKDAVKTIDNRYTSKRVYSATQQKYISFYQLAMSPSRYDKFYDKLVENYSEYDIRMMSIASLGNALNSDFDEDDPYNREDSKDQTVEAFQDLEAAGYSLMTESGNAYTWKYVDHLINMDLDSSRYVKASASVPFLGAVLHGYVQFAGTPFNEEGDTDYALLKAIENGSGLYFILSYRNTEELKEDPFYNQYYSVRYDIWRDDMIRVYNELNSVMGDLQTSVIVEHYFVDGEHAKRVPDIDELRADILAQMENALQAEAEKEQNATTDALVSIADARTCTATLKSRLEKIIEQMQEENKSLTSSMGFYTSLLKEKDALKRGVDRLLPVLVAFGLDMENEEIVRWVDGLENQLNSTKNNAVSSLAVHLRLQRLYEEAYRLYAEAEASIALIAEAKKVNPALSDELVAALVAEAEAYVEAAAPLLEGMDTDGDPEGVKDYGVNVEMERNAAFFTEDGPASVYTLAMDALTVLTAQGTEYQDIDGIDDMLMQVVEDSLFTVQDIKDSADAIVNVGGAIEEDTSVGAYDKYKVDPNSVVVISYGQRDSATHEKTVQKTFILNYNNYAVRVTYAANNITYTIPAGGYVVIE